jgi:hypothetical protein
MKKIACSILVSTICSTFSLAGTYSVESVEVTTTMFNPAGSGLYSSYLANSVEPLLTGQSFCSASATSPGLPGQLSSTSMGQPLVRFRWKIKYCPTGRKDEPNDTPVGLEFRTKSMTNIGVKLGVGPGETATSTATGQSLNILGLYAHGALLGNDTNGQALIQSSGDNTVWSTVVAIPTVCVFTEFSKITQCYYGYVDANDFSVQYNLSTSISLWNSVKNQATAFFDSKLQGRLVYINGVQVNTPF